MNYHHPLDGTETLRYEGERFTLDRVYFPKGFRNEPVRVWATDETEIQYRSDTRELIAVSLETGERTFAEIGGRDGDELVLEPSRK